jgi:outer membrane protein assembly factor BamA
LRFVLLFLLAAAPAQAAVTDYIDKPIADIRLQVNGADLRDPALLEMIETRPGEPLAIVEVRESMAHLFGLGLYHDVQVDAAMGDRGVVLTYNLTPAQRFRRIVFEGSPGLPEAELRRILIERHGSTFSLARASQLTATLQGLYRDRGYPAANITVGAGPGDDPSNATMVIAIRPGQRARIAEIEVQGSPREPVPQ